RRSPVCGARAAITSRASSRTPTPGRGPRRTRPSRRSSAGALGTTERGDHIMRHRLALVLIVALAGLVALAAPVAAQLVGPGGLLNQTSASVAITNSSTATSLYSFQIPAGLTQLSGPPLHLKLLGTLSTSIFPGAVNLGCNWGGSTASIALVNG